MITLTREINQNNHGDHMRVEQTCFIPLHSRNVVDSSRFMKRARWGVS